MKKLYLLADLLLLALLVKDLPTPVSSVHTLDVATCIQNFLKVPFHFKHSPVLLNVNCS